jgi:hypothetical protein
MDEETNDCVLMAGRKGFTPTLWLLEISHVCHPTHAPLETSLPPHQTRKSDLVPRFMTVVL